MARFRLLNVVAKSPGHHESAWLSKGDTVSMDVPGGRVTLAFRDVSSNAEISFCDLTFAPIREGLTRFERRTRPAGVEGAA